MVSKARGPNTLKGAMITVDSSGSSMQVIPFYYNPSTLRRNLQPQMVGGEEQDRSMAVRFKSAPVEVLDVEVQLDAADQLEDNNTTAVDMGIHPYLAALELLVYPSSSQVTRTQSLLASGAIEVAPLTAPSTLFVWGPRRVLPVRLNSYSISEEMFDANLNPIRATVSLNMRVLNYSDLSDSNRGYHEFMVYQHGLEAMARKAISGLDKNVIGISSDQI